MPAKNFSIEQLDQFNIEDNTIPAFNEVGIKPPEPKDLKYLGEPTSRKPTPPPLPPKPNTALQTPVPPPPPPPTTFKQQAGQFLPQQQVQAQALYLPQQPLQQQQLYNQQQNNVYNVPSGLIQPQPFNAYNAPQPFNATGSQHQMDMVPPIGYNPLFGYPPNHAVKCPHCNNIVTLESLLPVAQEPCCNDMPPGGGACCKLPLCPGNEGPYNQAPLQGQYQGIMEFAEFQSAQACCQRQLNQVPSLTHHKEGLLADTLNLPPSTRALTKNLNSISASSLTTYPYQGHEVCQCSRNKPSNVKKDIYQDNFNKAGEQLDENDNTYADSSELFLECLRKLTFVSQKLLDNFEHAMSAKSLPKTAAIAKVPPNIRQPVTVETKYEQQSVRLEPIRVTVPLTLKFV